MRLTRTHLSAWCSVRVLSVWLGPAGPVWANVCGLGGILDGSVATGTPTRIFLEAGCEHRRDYIKGLPWEVIIVSRCLLVGYSSGAWARPLGDAILTLIFGLVCSWCSSLSSSSSSPFSYEAFFWFTSRWTGQIHWRGFCHGLPNVSPLIKSAPRTDAHSTWFHSIWLDFSDHIPRRLCRVESSNGGA